MFTRSLKILFLIVLIAAALGLSTSSPNIHALASRQADGQTLADSGFRPDKNGFGFENYTNDPGPVNLTPNEVRRMFGDQVCGAINGDKCMLTPPAEAWMNQVNNAMNGGHCEGMAVLSLLMASGKEKPSSFGADQTVGLPFQSNAQLTQEIAYFWATQTTSPTNDTYIYGTPTDIVNKLVEGLKSGTEQYVLAVRNPEQGGHAITPYAVVDKGNNIVWIMVYDNNIPKTERHVEVNLKDNTWAYNLSTNPNIQSSLWTGNAESQTMLLKPMSPRFQKQYCPFCSQQDSAVVPKADNAAAAQPMNEITLTSSSKNNLVDLLITDEQGHRLGYQGGKLYKEIPGASAIQIDSGDLWQDKPEPIYSVPVGIKFTITIDGTNVKQDETANISMVGPDHDVYIDDIKVSAGEKDTLAFAPNGSQIVFTPNGDETPDLGLGFTANGADYGFLIKGGAIEKGQSMTLSLDVPNASLTASTTNKTEQSVIEVSVERVEGTESKTFDKPGLTLDPGTAATIEFGKWNGTGDVPITIAAAK